MLQKEIDTIKMAQRNKRIKHYEIILEQIEK